MDFTHWTTEQLWIYRASLISQHQAELGILNTEIGRRREEFCTEHAVASQLTDADVEERVWRLQSEFDLPLHDWCKFKLVALRIEQEEKARGCLALWPIVGVTEATKTDEYRLLFEHKDTNTKGQ